MIEERVVARQLPEAAKLLLNSQLLRQDPATSDEHGELSLSDEN